MRSLLLLPGRYLPGPPLRHHLPLRYSLHPGLQHTQHWLHRLLHLSPLRLLPLSRRGSLWLLRLPYLSLPYRLRGTLPQWRLCPHLSHQYRPLCPLLQHLLL